MGKVLVVLLRWADAIALWWNSPNSARGATKAPNSPGAPRGAQGRGSRKGTSKAESHGRPRVRTTVVEILLKVRCLGCSSGSEFPTEAVICG